MKKTVVVCDFDGVCIDSTPVGFRKMQSIMVAIGLSPVSDDFLRSIWGRNFQEVAEAACLAAGGDAGHVERFIGLDSQYSHCYQLDRAIYDALSYLRQRGHLTGLLTSRTRGSLQRVCAAIGFDLSVFGHLQTTDDGPFHKPHKRCFEPFLPWLAAHDHDFSDVIYCGDTLYADHAAVVNSGLPISFVGVVSGINTAAEFQAAGAEQVVMFDDFATFLGGVN